MTGLILPFHVTGGWFGFVNVSTTPEVVRKDGTVPPEYRDRVIERVVTALESHIGAETQWAVRTTVDVGPVGKINQVKVTVVTTSQAIQEGREDGSISSTIRDRLLKSAIKALETHREANARWTTENLRYDNPDGDEAHETI